MNSILITCEHAGNEVPKAYAGLFTNQGILDSHRGWDPGALEIASHLSNSLSLPVYAYKITRLLIEPNRSLENDQLFSEFSGKLSFDERQKLIDEFYLPFRNNVESVIAKLSKPVLHFSVHTFTPIWNGAERKTDIGILFDPMRKLESAVSNQLGQQLSSELPNLTIDFNKPYAGIDDGFTTYLRTKFADPDYAGIEVEVNQKFVDTSNMAKIKFAISASLKKLNQT